MTMTITGKKCPTCGDPIAPAKDAAQYNRNLAMHNRTKHGYKSPNFEAAQRYKANRLNRLAKSANSANSASGAALHWTQRPENRMKALKAARNASKARLAMDPAAVRRREYAKQWRANHKKGKAVQTQTSEVVACRLAECPACGTRFYMAKGTV